MAYFGLPPSEKNLSAGRRTERARTLGGHFRLNGLHRASPDPDIHARLWAEGYTGGDASGFDRAGAALRLSSPCVRD